MSKGLRQALLEAGASAVGRAAGVVMADGRGQEAVARAVGLAQRGFQLLESAQERALHLAGFAARPDYDDLHKQLARLKRKARELSRQIDSPTGAARTGSAAAHRATETGAVAASGAASGGAHRGVAERGSGDRR